MTTQLSKQARNGETLYRLCIYKDSKYIGNYNEGSIRKGKPAYYDEAGKDFFLPYVQELLVDGVELRIETKISE